MKKEPTGLETIFWILLAVFLVLLLTVGLNRQEDSEPCENTIYRNNHEKSCIPEMPLEKMT